MSSDDGDATTATATATAAVGENTASPPKHKSVEEDVSDMIAEDIKMFLSMEQTHRAMAADTSAVRAKNDARDQVALLIRAMQQAMETMRTDMTAIEQAISATRRAASSKPVLIKNATGRELDLVGMQEVYAEAIKALEVYLTGEKMPDTLRYIRALAEQPTHERCSSVARMELPLLLMHGYDVFAYAPLDEKARNASAPRATLHTALHDGSGRLHYWGGNPLYPPLPDRAKSNMKQTLALLRPMLSEADQSLQKALANAKDCIVALQMATGRPAPVAPVVADTAPAAASMAMGASATNGSDRVRDPIPENLQPKILKPSKEGLGDVRAQDIERAVSLEAAAKSAALMCENIREAINTVACALVARDLQPVAPSSTPVDVGRVMRVRAAMAEGVDIRLDDNDAVRKRQEKIASSLGIAKVMEAAAQAATGLHTIEEESEKNSFRQFTEALVSIIAPIAEGVDGDGDRLRILNSVTTTGEDDKPSEGHANRRSDHFEAIGCALRVPIHPRAVCQFAGAMLIRDGVAPLPTLDTEQLAKLDREDESGRTPAQVLETFMRDVMRFSEAWGIFLSGRGITGTELVPLDIRDPTCLMATPQVTIGTLAGRYHNDTVALLGKMEGEHAAALLQQRGGNNIPAVRTTRTEVLRPLITERDVSVDMSGKSSSNPTIAYPLRLDEAEHGADVQKHAVFAQRLCTGTDVVAPMGSLTVMSQAATEVAALAKIVYANDPDTRLDYRPTPADPSARDWIALLGNLLDNHTKTTTDLMDAQKTTSGGAVDALERGLQGQQLSFESLLMWISARVVPELGWSSCGVRVAARCIIASLLARGGHPSVSSGRMGVQARRSMESLTERMLEFLDSIKASKEGEGAAAAAAAAGAGQ